MRLLMCAVVLLSLLSPRAALADDKKGAKDKPKDSGQFDDLFGTPAKSDGSSLDAMKKATEGMGTKKSGDAMAPKVGGSATDDSVKFLNAFAAEKIVEDKKLGCQPAGRDKKRLTNWTFDEVPAKALPYAVCLTMQSASGREMSIDLKVVDPRGQRVNSYKDVVNFRGRSEKVDHVIEFEAPVFKLAGQYHYVIDIDGKEAARLPLFVVKVEGETSGAVGSAPSDLPPKQEKTPPTTDDPLKAATQRDP